MEESKLEKINKALDSCLNGNDCNLGRDKDCPYREKMFCCGCLKEDIQELLEKQKPKSVNDYESGGVYRFVGLKRGTCPSCSHEVVGGNSTKFCWNCGQAVKWE